MPNVDDALRYARVGIAVLPTWYPNKDGMCACPYNCRKSAAKHPIVTLVPKGVRSATTDEATIRRWWAQYPEANVSTALGPVSGGRIGFDVDDEATARALLALADTLIARHLWVAKTRRGCHICFRSEDVVSGQIVVYASDGTKMGELRGDGMYLVAPPSLAMLERQYTEIGGPLAPKELALAHESMKVVSWLLKQVGVTIGKKQRIKEMPSVDIPETELVPLTAKIIKFTPRGLTKQILDGRYVSADRSGTLWMLGARLLADTQSTHFAITEEEIAGLIKQADSAYYHKYSDGRSQVAADKQYWTIALRQKLLAEEAQSEQAQQTANSGGIEAVKDFLWDPISERLVYLPSSSPNSKAEMRVADARLSIVKETVIVNDDDPATWERSYTVHLQKTDGRAQDIEITDKEKNSPNALQKLVGPQLRREFGLDPKNGWDRFWPAANAFTLAEIPEERAFARTGFNKTKDGQDTFILPGAQGGITVDGLNADVRFHGFADKGAEAFVAHYGIGVRPSENIREQALVTTMLRELFACSTPHALMPILSAVLGAPLMSLGLDKGPPLLHVEGLSQQGKTSLVLAVMSVFGDFYDSWVGHIPISWLSASVSAINIAIHCARDLPMLSDDYKEDARKRQSVKELVHSYAERVPRSRMGQDQSTKKGMVPQCLWIGTGQDSWVNETSVAARTVVVNTAGDVIDKQRLNDDVIRRVAAREFQLIGGTYLRWLTRTGSKALSAEIEREMQEQRSNVNIALLDHSLSMVAALRTSEAITRLWIADELPDFLEQYDAARAANREMVQRDLFSNNAKNEGLAPFAQLWAFVREHIAGGNVNVKHRRNVDAVEMYLGNPGRENIGMFDEEYIYLTEAVAYGWYKKLLSQQRSEVLHGWQQTVTDARKTYGLRCKQMSWQNKKSLEERREEGVRAIWVPRRMLEDVETVAEGLNHYTSDNTDDD